MSPEKKKRVRSLLDSFEARVLELVSEDEHALVILEQMDANGRKIFVDYHTRSNGRPQTTKPGRLLEEITTPRDLKFLTSMHISHEWLP